MSCSITSGYSLGCKDSVGGLKEIWIADFNSIIYDTIGINGEIANVDSGSFYKFELPPQTANFTSTSNSDIANQSTFFQTELVVVLPKLSSTTRNQFKILSQGRLAIIVVDRNGVKWILGYENGNFATTGTAVSGTAMGDLNGLNLTFSSFETLPPIVFTGSIPD